MTKRPGRLKKERKDATQTARQRDKFQTVMALVGIEADFRKLPVEHRDFVRQRPWPKPKTFIDASALRHPSADVICEKIDDFMALTSVLLEGGEMLLADYFTFFGPVSLRFTVMSIDPIRPDLAALIKRAKTSIESFHSRNFPKVLAKLRQGVDRVLVEYTKIDREIWWSTISTKLLPNRRWQVQVSLRLAQPQSITIGLDGKREQPAFRCGATFGTTGLRWVSWPSRLVQKGGDESMLPVYVQKHALDALRERVTFSNPDVEDYLWQSLMEPKIQKGDDRTDEFLVEYRLRGHHLGYLPVRRLADKIIVKTFLFLTMSGTPQGRMLYNKLGLERRHREQMALDQLNLFLTTDIQDDPVLRRVFAECGCGHLLDMAKPELRAEARVGVASDLRNFLGINSEEDLKSLGFGGVLAVQSKSQNAS